MEWKPSAAIDPRLKLVMQQIRELCKAHDVGVAVVLVSDKAAEFGTFAHETSWSCLHYEGNGKWRIKVKAKTGGPEEKRRAELTAHMLHTMRDCAAQLFTFADNMVKRMHEHFTIEHTQHPPLWDDGGQA